MNMYVIYLSSVNKYERGNCYGYYCGKTYTVQGEIYPYTDSVITEKTKRYKSMNTAENSAILIYNKCGFVMNYEIKEVEQ
jgi:hypothetical protein